MFTYREANTADIDSLTQMRVAMLCDGTDHPEEFRKILQNNSKQYMIDGLKDRSFIAWVAVFKDELVAMGGLVVFDLPPNDWCPSGKTAYIGNMYTKPTFRQKGIASKLVSLIVEEAKKIGCERILLNTTDMGRSIYEKYGFEDSPTAMAYYPFGIGTITHGASNTD